MSSETTKNPTCGRCRHCRWTRGNRDTGTCYLTRETVQMAADASQCSDYTEPIIAPEDIEVGCYGDDEDRVYVVTAACQEVNYLVIGTSCTFEGCLRLDPSGQYMGPMPRESLACRVTHRLETPELVWRKEGEEQIVCCAECGNELALEETDDGIDAYPCDRCTNDAHGHGYHRGAHDARVGQDKGPIL